MGRDIKLKTRNFFGSNTVSTGYILLPLSSGSTFFWGVDILDWQSKEECLTDVLRDLLSWSSILLRPCILHRSLSEYCWSPAIKALNYLENSATVYQATRRHLTKFWCLQLHLCYSCRFSHDVTILVIELGTFSYPVDGGTSFLTATWCRITQDYTLHRNPVLWFLT
jgi:hypothetical protein